MRRTLEQLPTKPVSSVNRLFFVLALTAACRHQAERPTADSQRSPNELTRTSATAQTPKLGGAPSPVSAEARLACASVAESWHAVAFSHLELRDTVANPVNRDASHPGRPDELGAPTPACLVLAHADSGIDHIGRPPYWPAADWVPILVFSADGPDGNAMTYQRGRTRCEVHNQWDGEDDSDSTYVPQKWFEQRTICWQHDRLLILSDTAQPTTR